jgi:Amt family ammonium transporter
MRALPLLVTKLLVGLRVDEQSEQSGLDSAQHRECLGA